MSDQSETSKFKAHLFICTRCSYLESDGKECPPDTAKDFRSKVKELALQKWDKKDVRVSGSGCLGHCEKGISSVLYPQGLWKTKLRPGNEIDLIEILEAELKSDD